MLAIEALTAAGLTGISVDFTLPDLVDTLSAKAFPLDADKIEAVRRELDTKDAGGLKAAGGAAYLPLLYATGPFDSALAALRELRERHRFMKGLFGWVGFNQIAVPYHREARVAGRSSFGFWKLWNFALEGITSFSTAPLRVATQVIARPVEVARLHRPGAAEAVADRGLAGVLGDVGHRHEAVGEGHRHGACRRRREQARQGQQGIGLPLSLIPLGPMVQSHNSFIQGLRLRQRRGHTRRRGCSLPQQFGQHARRLCSSASDRRFFHRVSRPNAQMSVFVSVF